MSSALEKAMASLVSKRPQAPPSGTSTHLNGMKKRKSTVDLTAIPSSRKRSKPDALERRSAGASSRRLIEPLESPTADKDSPSAVEQLQAQLLKLVKDQADDRARFQSKLDAQDSQLQRLQANLDERKSMPPYPRPPSFDDSGSEKANDDDEDDEVKSETSAPDLYNGSPEPQQEIGPVSRQPSMASQQRSAFEENVNLPPPETQHIETYDGMQMPYVIRELAPCEVFQLPANPNERFSHEFLKKVFGGTPISNGCYRIPPKNRERRLFPDIDVYRVLKAELEPLLPRYPGQHGAQLSCIFSEGDIDTDFPLFICDGGAGTGYRYYGTYEEPRASDLLGGSEMCCVPDHVKRFWSKLLGTPGIRKSKAALDTLIHAWPRVPVGWVDEETGTIIAYDAALEAEHGEALTRAITMDEAVEITEEEVWDALNRADYDLKASVDLFYEYLQCVGYDAGFYRKLVEEHHKFQRQKRG